MLRSAFASCVFFLALWQTYGCPDEVELSLLVSDDYGVPLQGIEVTVTGSWTLSATTYVTDSLGQTGFKDFKPSETVHFALEETMLPSGDITIGKYGSLEVTSIDHNGTQDRNIQVSAFIQPVAKQYHLSASPLSPAAPMFKFWELDSTHDFVLTKEEFSKYAGYTLSRKAVERIYSQVARKFQDP